MSGSSTIDIALLLVILSTIAQWVGMVLTYKRLKVMETMGKSSAQPVCAAAAEMVADHIATLATHTAELAATRASLAELKASNEKGHESINKKLDTIQMILMGGRIEPAVIK